MITFSLFVGVVSAQGDLDADGISDFAAGVGDIQGHTSADPFLTIDDKLSPGEAEALKSVIQETLYAFSFDEGTGAWTACNYAGQVFFTYTKDGMAEFSDGENTFGLSLLGVGRGSELDSAGNAVATANGRQLDIPRADYTEWYRNIDGGIEQGINIAYRPPGSGPLQIGFEFMCDGSLILEDSQTLIITDAAGKTLYTYTGLSAFSANGEQLPVSLATDGETLFWIIDDDEAAYPVIIDPVIAYAADATAKFNGEASLDQFGTSVALSADESTALVGAYGNNGQTGAAYLFEKGSGWTSKSAAAATAKFTGEASNDWFGKFVALSADGSTALIDAHGNNAQTGAVYIFEKGSGWTSKGAAAATAKFTGPAVGSLFGYSSTLSADGSTALIGAYGNNAQTGATYIFEKGGGWTSKGAADATAKFTGEFPSDYFGYSIALSADGSTALIGAYGNNAQTGATYIFEKGGGWTSKGAADATAKFTGEVPIDYFGYSTALSADGSTALVGGYGNNAQIGAVYIFEKGGGWTSKGAADATAKFIGPAASSLFGYSVALSADGSTALVGEFAISSGTAYLFKKGNGWVGKSAADATAMYGGEVSGDRFGYSVALSANGSTALIGADRNNVDTGAAYIIEYVNQAPVLDEIGAKSGKENTLLTFTVTAYDPDGTIPVITTSDLPDGASFDSGTFSWTPATGQSGSYTVTFIVSDGSLTDSEDITIIVEQGPVPPISAFSGEPTAGAAPLTVLFTDLSAGNPAGWAWFFGDESFTQSWEEMNPHSGWSAREDHSTVALPDGSILLMGGFDGVNYRNDTWRSIDNGATWTLVNESSGWMARQSHTSVVTPDGSIILMGGYVSSGGYRNDTWRSTDRGETWTQMNASSGWSARQGHTSEVMPDGSIVLMGGYDGTSLRNDVWRSVDNGASWMQVASNAGWSARHCHCSAVIPDGSLVVMGGNDGDWKNDVWRSIDSGITWEQIAVNAEWMTRSTHSCVVMPDGSIVLMGGSNGNTGSWNDVWRSTDRGESWIQVTASAGWPARSYHTTVVMPDGSIVLMGGIYTSGSGWMNDTWRVAPSGSSDQNPSHTYTIPGNYQVTLQAFNPAGFDSTRKTVYIRVDLPDEDTDGDGVADGADNCPGVINA
ncbi:MAG TPA: kelch repeat-containing protein, partial [Methanoregulaceae archaeon]|nr:kelch repeat-containing protein [Methanoregulaceae archaeon]HQN90534.1 kelch repeat-containing protein [Methanoregulaceae archaeon]